MELGIEPIELDVSSLQSQDFLDELLSTNDVALVDRVARIGSASWAVLQAATLLAAYRMKILFSTMETRMEAQEKTGYSSWTDWLQSVEMPVSVSLVRTRALEIDEYRRLGADWVTIANILAYSPTAGSDMLNSIVDDSGEILPHIDPEELPGGSVQGLMEALAAIPNPGQARRLVSDIAHQPRVYASQAVMSGGKLLVEVIQEGDDGDMRMTLQIAAVDRLGAGIKVPDIVARWLTARIGAQM